MFVSCVIVMDFLDKLGIDWKLFLAQLFNFAVLLFVLHRFLYKPVLKILDKRRKDIEENIEKTRSLEARLSNAETEIQKRLKQAEHEAQKIIHESRAAAESLRAETQERAEIAARKTAEEARKQFGREHDELIAQVKQESEEFIKKALLKIFEEVGGEELRKALEKKAINELKRLKDNVQ